MSDPELLATLYRGGHVESEHRGSIAVVDSNGTLVARAGNPYLSTFLRSSAKPFQALPVVSSGAADRFGFTDKELAVITASHAARTPHLAAVQSILAKIGLPETALKCGGDPSALHNNCSGKHAGMLALAVDLGLSTDDYLENAHKVQQMIKEGLCDVAGLDEKNVGIGVDGCSAPNFWMPLNNAARAFAQLAKAPRDKVVSQPSQPTIKSLLGNGKTWSRSDALGKLASVMMAHPSMVAGEGRLDTEVMRVLNRKMVTKGGAEGFQGVGILSRKQGGEPLGVAIKISDGNGRRAMGPVLIEVLRQLEVLDETELEKLQSFHRVPEKNVRGLVVGETRAEFRLSWL